MESITADGSGLSRPPSFICSMGVVCLSLSIRPSQGVRGEEILDGEGGRERSEKNGRVRVWVRLGFSLFAISLFRFSLPPFPPDPAITISFTVFVVIGATSIVFVSYFHYNHLYHCCSHFQKNPTLGLVLISRCHLKIYTVQMSKLPPISVSKFLDDVSTQILLLTSLSLRQSLVQPSWGCQLFWPHASRAFFRFALFRVFCFLFLDFLFIAEKECLNAAFQVFWSWLMIKECNSLLQACNSGQLLLLRSFMPS